tara:strand:- start:515 stop:676 length:162 start_codon:yes stop_codon:yes gene_type:complete
VSVIGPKVSEKEVELHAVTAYTSYVAEGTKEVSVAVPDVDTVAEEVVEEPVNP